VRARLQWTPTFWKIFLALSMSRQLDMSKGVIHGSAT
jgi:hypothetical protein